MFTEQSLRDNPDLVKAFTGLVDEVFWTLIDDVQAQMPEYERQRHERPDRQRAVGAGAKYDQPVVIRVSLVMTYLRLHIPQEAVAKLYGATQPDVSRELRRLMPLIVKLLPAPEVWKIVHESESLSEAEVLELSELTDGRVLVDATEQVVYRSEDNEVRKLYYSGKKKAFTLKTELAADADHRILAISEGVGGAMHDKKLSDALDTLGHLPDGCEVNADKGYQGLDKQVSVVTVENAETGEQQQVPRLQVKLPFKKPKGGELSAEQVEFNRQLGSVRVRVEHCIGWVKNWAIMATRFRCDHGIYTLVMQVVSGLVNRQTERWQAAKAQAAAQLL